MTKSFSRLNIWICTAIPSLVLMDVVKIIWPSCYCASKTCRSIGHWALGIGNCWRLRKKGKSLNPMPRRVGYAPEGRLRQRLQLRSGHAFKTTLTGYLMDLPGFTCLNAEESNKHFNLRYRPTSMEEFTDFLLTTFSTLFG